MTSVHTTSIYMTTVHTSSVHIKLKPGTHRERQRQGDPQKDNNDHNKNRECWVEVCVGSAHRLGDK